MAQEPRPYPGDNSAKALPPDINAARRSNHSPQSDKPLSIIGPTLTLIP